MKLHQFLIQEVTNGSKGLHGGAEQENAVNEGVVSPHPDEGGVR